MAAGDGLVIMTPTSIAHAGTSASINADGGVDFTAVSSLSLNGVFTSAHDNYLLVVNCTRSADNDVNIRLRASGSDATGSNYTYQYFYADGASIIRARSTAGLTVIAYLGTSPSGANVHLYGPYLAQPTAMRSVTVSSVSSAWLHDVATTHSLSTAYDGLTLSNPSGTFTGNVAVFGYEE